LDRWFERVPRDARILPHDPELDVLGQDVFRRGDVVAESEHEQRRVFSLRRFVPDTSEYLQGRRGWGWVTAAVPECVHGAAAGCRRWVSLAR
jgi:hypothetical protein